MQKILSAIAAVSATALMLSGCAAAPAGGAGESNGLISGVFMIVVMFAFMWLFMIRPENKRKKQADEMRNAIEVGDKIVTIGAMVGRVVHVTNDTITFETSEDRVRIEIAKWGVSRNEGKGSKEAADSSEVLNSNNAGK